MFFLDKSQAIYLGDSVTEGYYATTTANRWATLTAQNIGLAEINKGMAGTVVQNTAPVATNNFRDRYRADLTNNSAGRIFIMGGINDCLGTTYTPELYKNNLDKIVKGLILYGFSQNRIYLLSPSYVRPNVWADFAAPLNGGSDAKYSQIRTSAREIAERYKLQFVDTYTYMQSNGGNSLLYSDGVHPSDSGHQAIADAVVSQIKIV
ncbi:MAG TPA: SGNH/GDSL hydrolase family protein [Cyanophyceae cyanobacterium]